MIRTPYVYELTYIPLNKKYIGSRIANGITPDRDLWKKYFSSSKVVKTLRKLNGSGQDI